MTKRSFKQTLMIVILLCVSFGIIGSSFFLITLFHRTLLSKVGSNRTDILSLLGERAKLTRDNGYTLSNLYYYDLLLRQMLSSPTYNRYELDRYLDALNRQYRSAYHDAPAKLDYYVVLAAVNGYHYCSATHDVYYDYRQLESKLWYPEVLALQGANYEAADYYDPFFKQHVFSLSRILLDESGREIATLTVNINEKTFQESYRALLGTGNHLYIVNERGEVVSSSEKNLLGVRYFDMQSLEGIFAEGDYTITRIAGEEVLFSRSQNSRTGWTVIEDISLSYIMAPVKALLFRLILLTAGILLLMMAVAGSLSRKLSQPVQSLASYMRRVHVGSDREQCQVEGPREISELSRGLNDMLSRLHAQEERRRELEMGFLQAQINPHFLYNTLFSIKCLVGLGQNEKAEEMLKSFIQLLRLSLSDPCERISLEEEFSTLSCYLDVQKYRFGEQLDSMLELDEAAASYSIPKLLLQPLVENAITHGIGEGTDELLVLVTARLQGEGVEIVIQDNGVGMSEEIRARILRPLLEEEPASGAHIGLRNVRVRLKLHYGEEAAFEIHSAPDEGCLIRIRLPKGEEKLRIRLPRGEENEGGEDV